MSRYPPYTGYCIQAGHTMEKKKIFFYLNRAFALGSDTEISQIFAQRNCGWFYKGKEYDALREL